MLIPHIQEQIELDLETAHGQVMTGYLDPAVSPDSKLIAAAIALAGAEIALALGTMPGDADDQR